MKIAYLAAGAAGMICGSCLRDNRLAATLLGKGRDVVLIPLYTPLTTDEIDVSKAPIYYGGINVYLEQRFPLFRHLPSWLFRLLDTPALLRRVMRFSANVGPADLGALTVSVLRGEHGAQQLELTKLIRGLGKLQPDLVHLPNLPFVGVARELKRSLGAKIFCTLSGEDIFLDELEEPYRTQSFDLIQERSEDIDAFVATSNYYADHAIKHFQLPQDRVHVVPMGIHVDDFADGVEPPADPFTISYLARICPAKGLSNLCDALVKLRAEGRNCRVRAAGYLSRTDRPYLAEIEKQFAQQDAAHAFEYLGEIDRAGKISLLQSSHVLSVPTVYHEAKGLYVLEALAAGVPVVQPRHGSFPELIEATGGGLLYDPLQTSDATGLADAIAQLMDDPDRRRRMGQAGQAAVRQHFNDEVMADRTWALYENVCSDHTNAQ